MSTESSLIKFMKETDDIINEAEAYLLEETRSAALPVSCDFMM